MYVVLFLILSFHEGIAQEDHAILASEKYYYLHLAHTRTSTNPDMDEVAEKINYSYFDMLWLGGDLALSTSQDDMTMIHVDSIYHLGNSTTLWALGNHDYADLERIQAFTGRPPFYAVYHKGITFLVLDTQDSLSNIIGQQKELFDSLTDTIAESSHLVLLHHKLIWMYGDNHLQPQIPYISNGGLGDCPSCINPNNFYSEIYPVLLEVEDRGIEVICLAGDIGFRQSRFEYLTQDGIQYLASGIESGNSSNMALLFQHDPAKRELSWEFVPLSDLLPPLDLRAPDLYAVSISPDSISGGDSIRITIAAEDSESGLKEIELTFDSPNGEQSYHIPGPITEWNSSGDHVYTQDLVIADTAVTGTWVLSSISVSDSAGNSLFVDREDTVLASFVVFDPLASDMRDYPSLILYPVPSSGIFHISGDPGIKRVEVTDRTGRLIKVFDYRPDSIDLTNEADGVYFIRLRMYDKQVMVRKVIKLN